MTALLVAEDNPDDLFLLQQAFKKAGIAAPFASVSDGVEAIAYLEGEGIYRDRVAHPFPGILLLDLNMPRRNGFEVLEWVRQDERCHRLMIHVFTASARPADLQRAYDLKANSFVVKPTRMDELVEFAKALQMWHRFVRLAPPPEDIASGSHSFSS